jgi:hypothetical protein
MDSSKEIAEYFKKESTQETLAALAVQFNTVFAWDWFTLNDCRRIFKQTSDEQLSTILISLHISGFIILSKKKKERFRFSKNFWKKTMLDGLEEQPNT